MITYSSNNTATKPGKAPIQAEIMAVNILSEKKAKKEVAAPMSTKAHATPKRKLIMKPSGLVPSRIVSKKSYSCSESTATAPAR